MDQGHYNCRDYHITPHFSATTIVSESNVLQRHESFDELEARSRSPESQKPKFPLFKLPLELRQHILSYLLPHTREFKDSGRLSEHARNFSAVKKRGARGMALPSANGNASSAATVSNVVWQRGNINVLSVCKQLHEECAKLIYGTNTFLLFVTYDGILWRFRWLLPSGLAPSRSYSFLELMPERYLGLIKRLVVHVDHVDSYTSMIKYSVGAQGFKHGLTRQVQRLVIALRGADQGQDEHELFEERRLAKLHILLKSDSSPQKSAVNLLGCIVEGRLEKRNDNALLHKRCAEASDNLEEILEPLSYLRCVRDVTVGGVVSEKFAKDLVAKIRSDAPIDKAVKNKLLGEGMSVSNNTGGVQLCVYGNDL